MPHFSKLFNNVNRNVVMGRGGGNKTVVDLLIHKTMSWDFYWIAAAAMRTLG